MCVYVSHLCAQQPTENAQKCQLRLPAVKLGALSHNQITKLVLFSCNLVDLYFMCVFFSSSFW